jgi:hypothetical protein
MFLPWWQPWWQPWGWAPYYVLRPWPRRRIPPPLPPVHAPGALPILGASSPFQYGPAVIDPGELFFRAGHPIGGPSESFRGVSATVVPFYASILGSGAPLSPGFGIAGAPIYRK